MLAVPIGSPELAAVVAELEAAPAAHVVTAVVAEDQVEAGAAADRLRPAADLAHVRRVEAFA